ncbi:MAG: hypothetical protein L6R36_003753 [Xanthoria steineri]|nr:MAG: hypothetical protein L6R36_003753 [Xanthoria steineri]
MWGFCVTRAKTRPDSIRLTRSEQSDLSYDDLCQIVHRNQKEYTAAKAEHLDKNATQLSDSAYRFGRTVEQFLNDFPDLLGPAHALDNQYGGLVLPAVRLLWQVVSSKQRYEEQMQQQLDRLLEQFTYLQKFGSIYRGKGDIQTDEESNDLQELLKPVFEAIARFLHSSAEYYQLFRRAAISPHGPDLDDVRSLVQKAQKELSLLLANDARETRITTTRITHQCAKLEDENSEIKKQLQAQDEQRTADRLACLRRLLNTSFVNEQRKTQYENDLHRTFDFNQRKVPKYQDALKVVDQDYTFLRWQEADSSTILILSGHSSGTQSSQRFCWLSAAAMNLIDNLHASNCAVAFFIGQLGTTPPDWRIRSTDKEALPSMMSQIASWNPSCLQKVDFKQHIVHKDWESDDFRKKTEFLRVLLETSRATEPLYLVFDNVSMYTDASTTLSTRPPPVLIRRLLELVRDVQVVVKILFVGLKEDFDEEQLDYLRETIDGINREQLLYRVAWDSAKAQRIPVY